MVNHQCPSQLDVIAATGCIQRLLLSGTVGVPHAAASFTWGFVMRKLVLPLALAAATWITPAFADTLLTSNAGYTGPGLDLGAYANGSYNFTFGPVPVDGFTFTSNNGGGNSGMGSVVGQGSYGLLDNGSFGGDAVYIGVDSPTGYAQLLGTTGYSQIGFFMNYAPGSGDDPTISTLDASGNVITSYDLATLAPISTPDGFNEFEFRGIAADAPNSIYGLRFGGSYILVTGTANGEVAAVPEPATWALGITGFGLAGGTMRRARATVRFA